MDSGKTWITAYIELPEDYDEENIFVTNQDEYITDNDEDGILECMVKFDKEAVAALLSPSDEVELTVTGKLTDGTPFRSSDTIKVKQGATSPAPGIWDEPFGTCQVDLLDF